MDYMVPPIDLGNLRVLDTETTGLNDGMQLDEPVEIAVTDALGTCLFHSYICPNVEISAEALATHHIDHEQVANAPTYDEVMDQISQVVGPADLWVYNAPYDMRIMNNAAISRGVLPNKFSYACAMRAYAQAFGVKSERRPGEFKWWSLGAAYEQQFGIVLPGQHSALVDCQMTARLLTLIAEDKIAPAKDSQFRVVFTHLTIEFTKSRAPYAVFTTEGGQKVNVFQDRWSQLTRSGFPIHAESGNILKTVGASKPVALDEPMGGIIFYKGEWPELAEIGTGVWGD